MQVDSDSLGGYLRVERERQHVSLRDIAAATKIQVKFLEALERDDYERLPPTPFVVGFLRAYAQYLSLDVEAILAAYRTIYRVPEEPESAQPLVIYPARRSKRLGTIGMAILAVALLVTVSAMVQEWGPSWRIGTPETALPSAPSPGRGPATTALQTPPSTGESNNVPKKVEPLPSSAPSGSVPAKATVQTPPLVGESNNTPKKPASVTPTPGEANANVALSPSPAMALPSETTNVRPTTQSQQRDPLRPEVNTALVLQAQALEDTWLRVEIDGAKDKRREVLLASGKSLSLEATERFSLTVGNVKGLRVTLNGQEMPLPQSRSNVVRDFQLTRAQLN